MQPCKNKSYKSQLIDNDLMLMWWYSNRVTLDDNMLSYLYCIFCSTESNLSAAYFWYLVIYFIPFKLHGYMGLCIPITSQLLCCVVGKKIKLSCWMLNGWICLISTRTKNYKSILEFNFFIIFSFLLQFHWCDYFNENGPTEENN